MKCNQKTISKMLSLTFIADCIKIQAEMRHMEYSFYNIKADFLSKNGFIFLLSIFRFYFYSLFQIQNIWR
jgi:hypothetical protein